MKCKTSYYGGLYIDHITKESISPDNTRKPLTKRELTEMHKREKIMGCNND